GVRVARPRSSGGGGGRRRLQRSGRAGRLRGVRGVETRLGVGGAGLLLRVGRVFGSRWRGPRGLGLLSLRVLGRGGAPRLGGGGLRVLLPILRGGAARTARGADGDPDIPRAHLFGRGGPIHRRLLVGPLTPPGATRQHRQGHERQDPTTEEQRTRQGAMRALPRAGGILGGCDEGAGRGRRFEGRRRGGALGERALGERALEQGTLREGALREGALGCGVLGQRALLGGVLWEARRGGTGRGVLGGGGAARGAIAACPRRLGSRGRSAGG